jgi:uncharacterized protein (TIGR03083 family)
MTTGTAPVSVVAPRKPRLQRDVAMRLAGTEYSRFVEQLRQLAPEDWSRPTGCPDWDVHAMACHVLGLAEMAASPVETVRQMRAARRAGGLFIDALTDLQFRKHEHRSPENLVELLAKVGPKAARGRQRTPAVMRHRSMGEQPVDETGSQTETWTLGYLLDIIMTRDTWMHRSDIAAATGREMTLSPAHDGILVADIAAEWATRHGQPCSLTLTGPAGGSWAFVTGGQPLQIDAVEFCRVISGRGAGEGLLATRVPF